jgi:uncharacterized protein (TIGR02145 family)
MMIHSGFLFSQKVGIGTTVPVATLNLIGPGALPSIPGMTSTGIFRIAVAANEAIDIGKMVDSTFAGWIQSGYNGNISDPLSLQPMGGNVGIGNVNPVNRLSVTGNANITGNVGIGTTTPTAKLQVVGTLKVVDGTQGAGKILTSDVAGLASWQSLPPPPAPPAYITSTSICCQSWMIKNLDVSTYRNGDAIPKVTNAAAWAALTTGAYCYYNNDSTTYAAIYGKLYNWYAINDPRGLSPEGWHIPSAFELMTLIECLGGSIDAGGKLKEKGTTHWSAPNTGATNLSGFTGLPGGLRLDVGTFAGIGTEGPLWGSTDYDTVDSYYMSLGYNVASSTVFHFNKKSGFSIRCIRD